MPAKWCVEHRGDPFKTLITIALQIAPPNGWHLMSGRSNRCATSRIFSSHLTPPDSIGFQPGWAAQLLPRTRELAEEGLAIAHDDDGSIGKVAVEQRQQIDEHVAPCVRSTLELSEKTSDGRGSELDSIKRATARLRDSKIRSSKKARRTSSCKGRSTAPISPA